jgi:hypothetical protein
MLVVWIALTAYFAGFSAYWGVWAGWDLARDGLAEVAIRAALGVFVCAFHAGMWMLYFVGIPSRVALNVIFKERRRQRFGETVMCVVAFLSLSLAFLMGILYPPE